MNLCNYLAKYQQMQQPTNQQTLLSISQSSNMSQPCNPLPSPKTFPY